MKKLLFIALILLYFVPSANAAKPDVFFNIKTSTYAYNAENTAWEDTRTTLTYFETFIEPTFSINFNKYIGLELGAAMLVPFTFEFPSGVRFFPVVTSTIGNKYVLLTMGTMKKGHNLPYFIRDPLIDMSPVVRSTPDNNLIEKGPEEYRYGDAMTHGFYELGASFEWFVVGAGEVYMNWQILHNPKHRERFDVGLMHAFSNLHDIFTPYIAIHYWHNGGHEYPLYNGAPSITENYVGTIGINSKYLSILYTASYNIWDRDNDVSQFGHGIFLRGTIPVKTKKYDLFEIEPLAFVSGWYINNNHKFISVEGDPFFRVPFYFGINLKKTVHFEKYGITLDFGLINGVFLTYDKKVAGRYDQTIRFNFTYHFPVGKRVKDKNKEEEANKS